MSSPEFSVGNEQDPRLSHILEQYGDVLVLNHQNQPQPLSEAVEECPPLVSVLLNAETPEQLQGIIDSQKVPE